LKSQTTANNGRSETEVLDLSIEGLIQHHNVSDTDEATSGGGGAVDRNVWITKLEKVDPKAAHAVYGCGTYGTASLAIGADNKVRLYGGLCKRHWDCPICGAIHAKQSTEQLSDVVEYLTTHEGMKEEQFIFVTLGMRNSTRTSTRERVERMGDALTKLVNQRWFKRQVLGYEMAWDFAGSLLNGRRPWINAHLHGLWIIREGVVLDDLKHQVFDFLKRELGNLIGWDEHPELWEEFMQHAMLSPAMGGYIHGRIWRGSHEVGATNMKHDKQLGGYRNHFDRDIRDLEEIQPLIRSQLVRNRRGGIIPKVRKVLSLREEIHDDVATMERLPLPPQFRLASSSARKAFRELVAEARTPLKLLQWLMEVPEHISPERWESEVLSIHGSVFALPSAS